MSVRYNLWGQGQLGIVSLGLGSVRYSFGGLGSGRGKGLGKRTHATCYPGLYNK